MSKNISKLKKSNNKRKLYVILGIIILILLVLYFGSKLILISIVTKDKLYDSSVDINYKETIINSKILLNDEYYSYKNIKFKNIIDGYEIVDNDISLKLKKDENVVVTLIVTEDSIANIYNQLKKDYNTHVETGFKFNSILSKFYTNADKDFILNNKLMNGIKLEKLCVDYMSDELNIFDSYKRIVRDGSFLSSLCSYYEQTFFKLNKFEGVYGFMNDNYIVVGLTDNINSYSFYFNNYFEGGREEIITQVENFISSIVIE